MFVQDKIEEQEMTTLNEDIEQEYEFMPIYYKTIIKQIIDNKVKECLKDIETNVYDSENSFVIDKETAIQTIKKHFETKR